MPPFSPDQYEAFWTGVAALATVVASIVAIVTLIALRRDSADRTRPMMTVELRPVLLVTAPRRSLVLRNVGPTPATAVHVTFDPPLPRLEGPSADGRVTPYLVRRYAQPIATWPPGMTLSNLYFVGEAGPEGRWTNREPLPDQLTVTIAYTDVRGRSYNDTYHLDDRVWATESFAEPSSSDEKGYRKREVRALEAIARRIGHL